MAARNSLRLLLCLSPKYYFLIKKEKKNKPVHLAVTEEVNSVWKPIIIVLEPEAGLDKCKYLLSTKMGGLF